MKKINRIGRPVCRQGRYFVYILECRDGTFYTGYTKDLERRILEHNGGKRGAKYLRGRGPVRVVWCKEYRYKHYAMSTEYEVKHLSRSQKELLINGMRLDKVLSGKIDYGKK